VSRSHGPTNSSIRVIPPPKLFEILGRVPLPSLLGNGAKAVTRRRMLGWPRAGTPEPTQARSAEPREIFEVRGKTYRLRLFRNSDPLRAWEVSRRCDQGLTRICLPGGQRPRESGCAEPYPPWSYRRKENPAFRHQSTPAPNFE
jgi:hypothetical protein